MVKCWVIRLFGTIVVVGGREGEGGGGNGGKSKMGKSRPGLSRADVLGKRLKPTSEASFYGFYCKWEGRP